ncbi:hypothetical protein [Bradyrhizobium lablabi]|uniref:Uncharacterized protein n=1 Tax=Bradyrhizobium lablabi TaxID=722472 RepID=A0A1H5JGJ7_9BRAD|nr:hypothetical protein [Bradyrhizobium lablabi]SEE51612.1 hypothetical protein SAMN05444171_7815 [Bradyrhizobium lablabi]SEE53138.1 hypothetical protein SAMN05444171_7882 [Bradyrhizobium lablabi]
MAFTHVAPSAKDGGGSTITGGIRQADTSGAGTGPNMPLVGIEDSTGAEIVGTTADAAVAAGAVGSLSAKLRAISRDLVSNIVLAAGSIVKLGDGTNNAAIKAASTAPAAADPALVVAISPNSVNANGQATMANSAPVVIASNQTSIPVAATLGAGTASVGTVQAGVTATANGATASRINAAASTNATSLKVSAGQLYTIDVFNAAAYNVFLKLYNKASAPTVGTDTPVMTIPVQAGGGYSKTWPMGLSFATGIAYAITKLQADSDTTVVVAGDLTGNTTWI